MNLLLAKIVRYIICFANSSFQANMEIPILMLLTKLIFNLILLYPILMHQVGQELAYCERKRFLKWRK